MIDFRRLVAASPQTTSTGDATRRELIVVAAIAIGLVLVRSFVPTWYEGFEFDSDQAIVGLMGKHLAEFRAFPLFFYGQHYMLGVQAWLAAPFFMIAGASVFTLRLPLVLINAAVALLLIAMLRKEARLRPALGLVAALPFIMPTPTMSAHLLSNLGASVEPFLYVLILWQLRHRPIPFALVLTIGTLHREFTIFAVPALLFVMALDRSLLTRRTLERATTVVITCAVLWMAIDLLKMNVDVYGLRTGRLENGPLSLEMASMRDRMCFAPGELAARFGSILNDGVPVLFGARSQALRLQGANSMEAGGSDVLGWILPIAFGAMIGRLLWLSGRTGQTRPLFCLYLALIGIQSLLVYSTACHAIPGLPPILRYVLLAVLIPIAVAAMYLQREPARALKALAAAVLIAWTAVNVRDNLKLIHEYATNPPSYPFRPLADYLVAHNIKFARANYWDAYVVDFLAREQVIVASDGKMRVRDYERRVEEHREEAVQIERMPCAEGVSIEEWCIVGPPLPRKP